MIGIVTIVLNVFVVTQIDFIIRVLQVPTEVTELMREYLFCIFSALRLLSYIISLQICSGQWEILWCL